MKAVEIAIEDWEGPVRVALLGDMHLGNRGVREDLLEATAKSLDADNAYWLNVGDTIDAINVSDPRFDPHTLPDWVGMADLADLPACQVARYRHYFGRLGARCLAQIYGNHEWALWKHYERNIYKELCDAINLAPERRLGYSGFVRLRFRQLSSGRIHNTWTQVIYLHHGNAGGRLAGSKATALERWPLAFDADVYVVGHSHTKLVLQKRRTGIAPKGCGLVDSQQIMVNVGAFLDGGEGYAERAGLLSQALGGVELWFYPREKRIQIIQ